MLLKIKKTLIFVMFIVFFSYIFFVYNENSIYANISSAICSFFAFFIIFINRQNILKKRKLLIISIMLYSFSWFVADLIWLIYENFYNLDILNKISTLFYMNASFCMNIILIVMLFVNIYFIDKKQLLLDFIAIGFTSYYGLKTLLIVMFSDTHISLLTINETTISLFLNILLFIFFILAFVTFGKKAKDSISVLNISSVLLFLITDSLYIYQKIVGTYVENKLLDLFYMIPHMIFAISVFLENTKSKKETSVNTVFNNDNGMLVSIILFVFFIIDIILYKVYEISDLYVFNIFVVMIVYAYINMIYKHYKKNNEIMEYQKKLNFELEDRIRIRTKELEETNKKLIKSINTDSLTGLGNRMYILEVFEKYKEKSDFTLIIFDIVKFKNINYISGHKTADNILISYSKTVVRKI